MQCLLPASYATVLIAWLAGHNTARADNLGPPSSEADDAAIAAAGLDYWPGCHPRGSLRPGTLGPELGDAATGHLDQTTYEVLREMLEAGIRDKAPLCVVDSAVVRWLLRQGGAPSSADAEQVAELLLGLADSWRYLGKLQRALQLCGRSETLLANAGDGGPARMQALACQASIDMDLGELERAKVLANLLVGVAREWHDKKPGFPSELIKALKLKAAVLAKLGLQDEARTALNEAHALGALPNTDGSVGFHLECDKDGGGTEACQEGDIPMFDCTLGDETRPVCKRIQ